MTVMTRILLPAQGNLLKIIFKVFLKSSDHYGLTSLFALGTNTNQFTSLFLKALAGVKDVLWKKIGVTVFSG